MRSSTIAVSVLSALLVSLALPPPLAAQAWSADQQAVWSVIVESWDAIVAKDLDWTDKYVHPNAVVWGDDYPMPQTRASVKRWNRYGFQNSTTLVSEYRSAGSSINPLVTNWEMVFIPSPSMSMAPRPTKCLRASTSFAGHSGFGQRTATSPGARTTSRLQTSSPVRASRRIRRRESPLAVVRNRASFQTIGDEWPRPGSANRQRTFLSVLQSVASSLSAEMPTPPSPRQQGQFAAERCVGRSGRDSARRRGRKAIGIILEGRTEVE